MTPLAVVPGLAERVIVGASYDNRGTVHTQPRSAARHITSSSCATMSGGRPKKRAYQACAALKSLTATPAKRASAFIKGSSLTPPNRRQ
jgi:hypothetical protein